MLPKSHKGVQNGTKVAPFWETSKEVSKMTTFASQSSPGGSQRGPNRSPSGAKLGPVWCQSHPQRGPRGVNLELQGPSGRFLGKLNGKKVIYCKPTFSLGRRKSFLRFTGYSFSDVRLFAADHDTTHYKTPPNRHQDDNNT